jgi:DNA-binding transcriptional regulator YdaS (Cro superfamily)
VSYDLTVETAGFQRFRTNHETASGLTTYDYSTAISSVVDTTVVYHTVYNSNAGTQSGYLNGKFESSGSIGLPGSGDGPLYFGVNTGRTSLFALWKGRALTADEILWNYLEPYAFLRPVIRRRIFTGTSGEIIVPVGQATETDLAQPIAWAPKHRVVGQVTEADLAQGLTLRKSRTLGQVLEADLAQSVARLKAKGVSQVTETDTAQAWGRIKSRTIGQVSETDLAQAMMWAPKRRLVGMVSETDMAQAVFVVSAGQATLHILPVTGAGRT